VPILASQFAEVNLAVPDASVLTAPAARPGVGFSVTATPDLIAGLGSRNVGGLPATLAGQSRSADITGLNAVAVYGTGLARFVVVVVPRRTSSDATGAAVRAGGTKLTFPGGDGVVLSASVFSVLVMDSTMSRRGYVLAGLVDSSLLTQAGAELSSYVGARR
jgi:hypothetical protein